MKRLVKTLLAAVIVSSVALTAWAESVRVVTVEGNQRVESSTVLSYVDVKSGDEYQPYKASNVIKALYRTGLFQHVEVLWDAGNFRIRVEENPSVNRVAFEGNSEIADERMKEIVSLHPRSIFSPEKVQQDVQSILAYYRQSGYFLAEVTPQKIELDQNRVDVIYKVDEGDKTRIGHVQFLGNERFSDNELKSIIATKEARWWRVFSRGDVYDPSRVEVDKETLRRFYIESGYADFRVVSAVAELSHDKKSFYVTFTLSEGESYDFGVVDVRLDAVEEDIDRGELLSQLSIEKGKPYNGLYVENEIDNLVSFLGNKGYAFLDIRPQFVKNEADRTVDVSFNVVPGPRVYVNRINIRGNEHTRDYVVRREMRFAEGDAMSASKLERSRDRIRYLSYFDDVDVRTAETGIPDRVDVDVDVKEQSTGEFNIGLGFSSYEGMLATADIVERNFLGKGQVAKIAFSLSDRRENFSLGFVEPYFMGQELSAGVDLFNEKTDYQDSSSYDIETMGGGLRFGFPLSEYSRNTVAFGYQTKDVTNLGAGVSTFVAREQGEKDSLYVSNTYSYDTRDSRYTPTKGYRYAVTGAYSGFGTDVSYVRGSVEGSWHKELKRDWVLSLGGSVGMVEEIGDDHLPIFEHFRMGGNDGLRGFDFSGVGPRDATTDDALGGKLMVTNSVELSFPMGAQMKELGVNGMLFVDGGTLTDFEDDPNVLDSEQYRVSAGVGAYWRSPLGPLRFEFGIPLAKSVEDKTRVFNFSFGSRF